MSILFAAFLGYNPIQHLLGPHVLAGLPAHSQSILTGSSFFPHLISAPFRDGLHAAFLFAIVACLIAAAASLMRGGHPAHDDDPAPVGAPPPPTGGGPNPRSSTSTELEARSAARSPIALRRSVGDEIDDVDANRRVDGGRSPIGADQGVLVMSRGRGDQSVVESSASYSGINRGTEPSPRRCGGEREPRGREAALEPLQNDRRR